MNRSYGLIDNSESIADGDPNLFLVEKTIYTLPLMQLLGMNFKISCYIF